MLLTQIFPPGIQTTRSYKVQSKVEKLVSGRVSRPRYPVPPVQIISLRETQASENDWVWTRIHISSTATIS